MIVWSSDVFSSDLEWEKLGRPATEEDPALPGGDAYTGTLRVRNVVENTVVGLAERGVRSSIVRIPPIAHSTTDAGFLPLLTGLAKEKGVIGNPGAGTNQWPAVSSDRRRAGKAGVRTVR